MVENLEKLENIYDILSSITLLDDKLDHELDDNADNLYKLIVKYRTYLKLEEMHNFSVWKQNVEKELSK